MKLVPVVLSGGAGTRLWPLSRELRPKQFHALLDHRKTLLQSTVERLSGLPDMTSPLVICNVEHRFLVAEQLRDIGITDAHILLEPVGRNTAAAIAAVTAYAQKTFGDDVAVLVLSADHAMDDIAAFQTAVKTGLRAVADGHVVVFGVPPTEPHTGYGYIQMGSMQNGIAAVRAFVEKPDVERAKAYLASGDYNWNCGIFLFYANDMMAALQAHAPDVLNHAQASVAAAANDLDFVRLNAEAFAQCPNVAIDVAVMEKIAGESGKLVMVPLPLKWSDVGSWASIAAQFQADAQGNVLHGDVVAEQTRGTYVHAHDRLVATVGVEDLIVVDTADALLVAHKNKLDGLKAVVARLKSAGRVEADNHRRVYRPWGWYDTIDAGEGFKVKRLHIFPGGVLSLQSHNHRAEHWVVVRGVAEVTKGDVVINVPANASVEIPVATKHRLANRGAEILEIIETQTGKYLEEDDIIRFDDAYGRS